MSRARGNRIRIAVIGLGKIGSQFDSGRPGKAFSRTHVGTILANPRFELVGVCDPSAANRSRFFKDWGCKSVPAFPSVSALLRKVQADVVVVAAPSAAHFKVLQEVLRHRPRLIFCEKPFCLSTAQAARIHALASRKRIPIAVNYHRRWDERFARLKARLAKIRGIDSVTVTYRKGLFNNGSHAIDLLLYLFGPVAKTQRILQTSHGGKDPSQSGALRFKSGVTAYLVGVDGADYELLEFEIYCRDRKLKLEFGGYEVSEYLLQRDRWFKNYPGLVTKPKQLAFGPVRGFRDAYREIDRLISRKGKGRLASTSENALRVHQIIRDILK